MRRVEWAGYAVVSDDVMLSAKHFRVSRCCSFMLQIEEFLPQSLPHAGTGSVRRLLTKDAVRRRQDKSYRRAIQVLHHRTFFASIKLETNDHRRKPCC